MWVKRKSKEGVLKNACVINIRVHKVCTSS